MQRTEWRRVRASPPGGDGTGMSDHPFAGRIPAEVLRREQRAEERLPWPVAVLVIAASAGVLWIGFALLLAALFT